MLHTITPTVFYRTLNVEGLEIFYREAGPRDAPSSLGGPKSLVWGTGGKTLSEPIFSGLFRIADMVESADSHRTG